ncbi:MAG: hypothetical protein KC656_31610, partial [Myxococcales bacterium]|nr:hypothetical protein [Myxococcales bacterium]
MQERHPADALAAVFEHGAVTVRLPRATRRPPTLTRALALTALSPVLVFALYMVAEAMVHGAVALGVPGPIASMPWNLLPHLVNSMTFAVLAGLALSVWSAVTVSQTLVQIGPQHLLLTHEGGRVRTQRVELAAVRSAYVNQGVLRLVCDDGDVELPVDRVPEA